MGGDGKKEKGGEEEGRYTCMRERKRERKERGRRR